MVGYGELGGCGAGKILAFKYKYQPCVLSAQIGFTQKLHATGDNIENGKDQSFAFFDKYRAQSRDERLRQEMIQDLEPVDLHQGNGRHASQ